MREQNTGQTEGAKMENKRKCVIMEDYETADEMAVRIEELKAKGFAFVDIQFIGSEEKPYHFMAERLSTYAFKKEVRS